MDAPPDGRSAARVRRKPPPAFPYSPRYPLPDPSDPFAPLQVLRDRAHSAHTHAFFNPSNTSLVPTPPSSGENVRFSTHVHPNLPSLPRAVVHPSRSTEPGPQFRDGYSSDNFRPARPPRARTRPSRDSNPYFTDPDVSSSTSSLNHRPQNRVQRLSEKLTERQYHYRRRSQTLSIVPQVLPQLPLTDEPQQFERPVTEESSTTEVPHHPNPTFHLSQNQYTYDDRQSHGHVYVQADAPPTASTVDSHNHSHVPTSVHSGPATPPMTPDDTLTTSSVSVRDRSESLSPRISVSELPPRSSSKDAFEESDLRSHHLHRTALEGGHTAIGSGGLIEREVSQIRSADFPMLLGISGPDASVPPLVSPPRPVPVPSESEPERRFSLDSRRRSGAGLGGRKDSITNRLRRSSFLGRVRKMSDPSPPSRTMKLPLYQSTSSHVSGGHVVRSAVGSMIAVGSSSSPEVVRVSSLTRETSDTKRAKMAHRKSLSHVSLGVTPLPTVSFGPTASPGLPTENVSMTSTLVGGDPYQDEYGASTNANLPPLQPLQPPEAAAPRSQTVAQALELTPLPAKDAPLPSIRKDTRLPTPPTETWRSSRAPALSSGTEYDWRRGTQHAHPHGVVYSEDLAPEAASHATLTRPSTLISTAHASAEMEMDEIVLMRHSRLERSTNYEPEQASPSPPLLANSLLARPTSTAATVSHTAAATSAPPVSSSPISPHLNVPVLSAALQPVRADIVPQRGPSPSTPPRRSSPLPSRRYPESPLPAPPEELEPATPAPLPLSPPRRMDADLPTPLPQPPLPQPPPPPSLPPALPVARAPLDSVERSEHPPAPTSAPTRPLSPYENLPRRSEERRTPDDRQERTTNTYFPVAQARPPSPPPPPPEPQPATQPPMTSPNANRSRTKVEQTGTPYNSLRQRRQGLAQGTTQTASHAQLPFRPTSPSPPLPVPTRAQSPQPASVPRPQPLLASHHNAPAPSPAAPAAPTRAQSPQPLVVTSRAQSPPPRRAQSPPVQAGTPSGQQALMRAAAPLPLPPPPSSYTSHGHGLLQARSFASQPSSIGHDVDRSRSRSNAPAMSTESATTSPPYAASVESTPLPLPQTPSTTFAHPYREPTAPKHHTHSSRGLSEPETTTRSRTVKSARRHCRDRAMAEESAMATFDEHAGLTKDQLQRAAALTVVSQNGVRVAFGDLFRERKTIVIFIRHFWCAACQDYMHSISRNVDYQALQRAGIDMVIIGNGSPGMIKPYRNIFRTPIPIFTDTTMRLYAALGMTYRTNDPGPDVEKGEYVRHGLIGGLAMVVRNALRVRMPVWERGGDSLQLGGEFVLGPGSTYAYAHRMTTTRSHAPIREVLRAAGYHRMVSPGASGYGGVSFTHEEEEAWMEDRRRSLARMRAKLEKRRQVGTPGEPEVYGHELGYRSDAGSGSVSVHGSWTSSAEKHELQEQLAKKQARERERERGREQERSVRSKQKRQRRSLQVANPDVRSDHYGHHDHEHHDHRTHHSGARTHGSRNDTTRDDWQGGKVSVEFLNRHGRREDGYETEDGAAYAR